MPFCPECGCEYRQGTEQCSDCLVALVPEKPLKLTSKTRRQAIKFKPGARTTWLQGFPVSKRVRSVGAAKTAIVPVYKACDLKEAIEIKNQLSKSGVAASISDTDVSSDSGEAEYPHGVPVFVSRKDYERAREIIESSADRKVLPKDYNDFEVFADSTDFDEEGDDTGRSGSNRALLVLPIIIVLILYFIFSALKRLL